MDRRNFLRAAGSGVFNTALFAGASSALIMPSANATTPPTAPRVNNARLLSFVNTHTGDSFADAYWENGTYVPDAMTAIYHVMRDHRSGESHEIDPRLLDQLHTLKGVVETSSPFQIISGYRSPATNAALHEASNGVATRSLHMDGRAIDIRVGGVDTARLRDAALGMGAGGVGYYQASDFIHVDTGRVRRW
jgi:uncharacterized protein YcbK (DUF882 family)